jgi:D-inositol-3-phosphate glycosyltransferase
MGKRVFLNPLTDGIVGDDELNWLYNACDVGINTLMGEGWGLISFEHAAAGAAQVVPDHMACSELWCGWAELLPVEKTYTPDFSILEMGEVSVRRVAEVLEKVYRDPQHLQPRSQAAFTVTQKAEYS